MKKTILTAALMTILSSGTFACDTGSCSIPGNSSAVTKVTGNNVILSGSTASAIANGANSSSLSYSSNVTTASTIASGTAIAGYNSANCNSLTNGGVTVSGSVALKSDSIAYNVSTGNGTGSASAGSLASASVSGVGLFAGGNSIGHVAGSASGSSSANLASGVIAGKNGGAEEVAVSGSSFVSTAGASLETDGTCTIKGCASNGDTKVSSTSTESTAYSDKATFAIGGVALTNATAGSIVNAASTTNALAGDTAIIGNVTTIFVSKK